MKREMMEIRSNAALQLASEDHARRLEQAQMVAEVIGIPRDIINKVFEPLFATKQIGKGIGFAYSSRRTSSDP